MRCLLPLGVLPLWVTAVASAAPAEAPAAAVLALEAGVSTRGTAPATWSVSLDASTTAEQARAAGAGLSSRLYGRGDGVLSRPLRFALDFPQATVFAFRVQAASLGGASLRVRLDGTQEAGLDWPPAAVTHRVDRVHWLPVPAGRHEVALTVSSGVVVIPRYAVAGRLADVPDAGDALALAWGVPTPVPAPAVGLPPGTQVAGYRGLWFTLGQFYGPGADGQPYAASKAPVFPYGDKYSGGLGTYTSSHVPVAIYVPAVNRTFFVYGGTTGADQRHLLCMASSYDHATGTVPQPTVVHDKLGVNDPHDNPSLAIDDQGYLWVFVSGRARVRPGFKYRSLEPYSTAGFRQVAEGELTYPQPHWLPGRGFVHLFTRYTGVRELYYETSADGVTWGEVRKMAGIREPGHTRGGHYQTSCSDGRRVGTFFNRHPNGDVDRRTDLYYIQSEDAGQTWTTVGGQAVALPVEVVEGPARIVDYASATPRLNVYLCDATFDAEGCPAILYVTGRGAEPGPPNGVREFRVTRWTGRSWETTTICSTDHNYDMGSLYVAGNTWWAVVPSDPGPQPDHSGGELVRWTSPDRGATWQRGVNLTQRSRLNHNYARRPLGARDPFSVFWADGDPTQLTPSRLYVADSAGLDVRVLPYDMAGEQAVPKRWVAPAAGGGR